MAIEFSELALPITAPGAKQTLDLLATIDRQAQQTVENVTQSTTVSAAQMRDALVATNGDLSKAAQLAASQVQGAAKQAADATGAAVRETVQRTSAGVDRVVEVSSRRQAVALRQMSFGISNIANQTERTWGGALRGILGQTADIAFSFGAAGPIAAAVAVVGLSLFQMWSNQQRQIRETARVAATELRTLTQSGNLGQIGGRFGIATQLFSGDPLAVRAEKEGEREFEARQIGIQGIRQRIAEQQAIEARNQGGGALAQSARQKARDAQREWQVELDKITTRYEKLLALVRELEGQEGFAAGKEIEALRAGRDETSRRLLESLDAGRPDIGLLRGGRGERFEGANQTELRDAILQSVRNGLKSADLGAAIASSADQAGWIREWDAMVGGLGAQMGMSLADSISAGIEAAITSGSIGNAFEAMTGTALIAIGSMFQQIGTQALIGAGLFAKLQAFLIANPIAAIPAAIGLITFGGILKGLGASMGGGGGGGGGAGAGGGFGSGGQVIDRGLINPLNGVVTSPGTITPRQSNVYNVLLVGENDPVAQRSFLNLLDKAERRRS